jgi:hypothetical protein
MPNPPLRLKILFWIILGAFSTFFAEVFAGSQMFPFFNVWGIFVVYPLYTLHILVLGTIVFRYGNPRFYVLYAAGLIFGLYEAYITKILWNPTWNMEAFRIGGVAVYESLVLVLFWHAVLAFIVPLIVSETLLTKSRATVDGLPDRLKRIFRTKRGIYYLVIGALFFGSFQSVNSASYLHSIASGFSNILVLSILILIWRRWTSGNDYEMKQLMPGKKAFIVLIMAIIILYIITTATLRTELIPGIESQITIWIAYAIAVILLYLGIKKSRKGPISNIFKTEINFSWKTILGLALVFTFSSAILRLIGGDVSGFFVLLVAWPLIAIVGIILFLKTVKDVVSGRS